MSNLIHVYLAHPLGAGPDRNDNIENASRLAAELAWRLPIVPVCAWMLLARYWPEDNEHRGRGLMIDRAQIIECGEFWQTGVRISPGMSLESGWAQEYDKPVYDLTNRTVDEIVAWFSARKGFVHPNPGLDCECGGKLRRSSTRDGTFMICDKCGR